MPAPGTINLVANNGLYCTGALLPEFESLWDAAVPSEMVGLLTWFHANLLERDQHFFDPQSGLVGFLDL